MKNQGKYLLVMYMVPFMLSAAFAGQDGKEKWVNSLGMEFVRISPGTFLMGQSTGGDWDERPVHEVTISRPFYMGVYEVTNLQYEKFSPSHRRYRGRDGLSRADDEPVVYVSWQEATDFCRWLSQKEGKPYRLPTEAEWEYACRAGTTTAYYTGNELPRKYQKHQKQEWNPVKVDTRVGQTQPNPWGLYDMHGNVEEWCFDWYGPYLTGRQIDPAGYATGDFKVSRGGSHSTPVYYLRSANRSGTLPQDKHWLIGFRVVQAETPQSKPLSRQHKPLWARNVPQKRYDWKTGIDQSRPSFTGPVCYVNIPAGSNGPLYSHHNHQPAICACPNGDLLAIWYTTREETGRELAVAASRLRLGAKQWDPAELFWDAPDRNDHGSALWWDGRDTLYHFNGLGTDGTWGKLALVMRTSKDNGCTWSRARLIRPQHTLHHQVIFGVFRTREGKIIVPCDAVTGGQGGTAVNISPDGGKSWYDPGEGKPAPAFVSGGRGAWIAGIHAGVVQLRDGTLMALGRGNNINGQMPKSVSSDMGNTWRYSPSGLPPLGSGQRLVLRRLQEGPLFLASFARHLAVIDAAGHKREVSGLFAALSFDEGRTWPVKRLVTDDGPSRRLNGGGNTGYFLLSKNTAEPRGYLACTQSPDGMIHLISSRLYYRFNLAWIKQRMPATGD